MSKPESFDSQRFANVEIAMLKGKTDSQIRHYYSLKWDAHPDEVQRYLDAIRTAWLHTQPKDIQRGEHRARLLELYRRAIEAEAIKEARYILQDIAKLDDLNVDDSEAITISLDDAKARLSSNRFPALTRENLIDVETEADEPPDLDDSDDSDE